ncbi:MAG: efflux RND transporter periplasmic adaptor subunit [Candidatus Binatia bacterium]
MSRRPSVVRVENAWTAQPFLYHFVFFIGLLLCVACDKSTSPQAAPVPPPPLVVVTKVLQQDVPIYSEWLGTADGAINAQIRARVQGYLKERRYREGTFVRTGDLLFSIDDRTYQAALDQARGDLGRAEAALGKTQLDVARYTPLAKEGAISQQELDNAIQAHRGNLATVAAAQAAVKQAELNLEWTQVRSPIDGIAGIAVAQIGDLIEPNTRLTTVSRVDPIKVTFPISEREYLKFSDQIASQMRAEKRGEEHGPPLQLILADGSIYPKAGSVAAPDREVEVKTGTISIVSYFPNPDYLLRPGLYAKVRAVTDTRKGALLVPQRAVQELQGTYRVAVVREDNTVSLRPVRVGERAGSLWIIDDGVSVDDRVVIEGLQKVRDGIPVNPQMALADGETTPPVNVPVAPAATRR